MTRLVAISPTAQVSGAEFVLLRLLAAAQADGLEVICSCPDGPLRRRLESAGIRSADLPDLKIPPGRRVAAGVVLAERIARAVGRIRRQSADVFLVNGFFALPALYLARLKVPTAWLVHDVIHRPSWLKILRVTSASIDRAIAVSEAVADPLRRLGIPVSVIRNGTRWPVEPRGDGLGDPPHIIGCAAMLTSWKGQDVLLDAVAKLGRLDVTVELAGGQFPKDEPYANRLRERAARSDLSGRVAFLGHVDDPLGTMRRWAIAVSASVDPEAAPLNVLEAMSIGLPLVGTDHGGTPEVLGDAGILVPPRQCGPLADAISILLDDADRWDRCHRAGPALIASEALTIERQMAEVVRTLGDLAKAGSKAL